MARTFNGSGAPLAQADFDQATAALKVDAASLWAVLTVETKGFGFMPDRRPKILFERHVFSQRTDHAFDAAHPDISNKTPGGYSGGAGEYDRLVKAMALDAAAALESASWGLGQLMGYHATKLGYASADAMATAFSAGEGEQLIATARFIALTPAMLEGLRSGDWAKFALHYNGKSYAKNLYDTKLARFHALYQGAHKPDLAVRANQARLLYLNFDPHGIDGAIGLGTHTAVMHYQQSVGLPVTGDFDAATQARLVKDAGV